MESRNDILTELQNISPVMAGMAKTNVFSVPEGYFETLNHTIVASINDGVNIDEKNKADIPPGYFDNLADSILDKIKTEEESESDLLKSLRYKNTFEAPQGYFDNLTALILTKVNAAVTKNTEEFSELLNTIGKKNIFEVPQGYFDNLAPSVLTKINTVSSTEADEFSEALNGIGNKNIFEVPQGYFDNLAVAIVSKIQPKAAKVVSMRSWTSVLKYAAAAMLTGALALGVYKYSNTITPDKIAPVAVAKLDPVIEKGKAMNDEKFEEALNNLSETDIAKYLEKTSTESDVSVLMAGVEENNLPNQEDYLTDEKTLENFLKDIDTQKLNN